MSLLIVGATLQAVDFVADGNGAIAFNIAGGLHHAMRSMASGFCYVNDPVIGIMRLLRRGKRVAYIDIDAHHGDGVQKAFYNTDQVLTISLHETGNTLFPGTGFEYEIGEGEGKGYSVNLPFPPETEDDVYVWTFEEVIPELIDAFQPDVIVTQLGVDTFYNDPFDKPSPIHFGVLLLSSVGGRGIYLCLLLSKPPQSRRSLSVEFVIFLLMVTAIAIAIVLHFLAKG